MTAFFVRRMAAFAATLLLVAATSFVVMRAAPGGPFTQERTVSEDVKEALNKRYHLDLPVLFNAEAARRPPFFGAITETQFAYYLRGLAVGDLGPTYQYRGRTVNDVLAPSIPVSLLLGAIGLLIALGIGLPAGIYAAIRHNRWADRAAITAAMGGVILPNFILGPLLVMVFSFWLGVLPPAGWGRPADVILPAFLTGLPAAAMIARLIRSGMIEEMRKDYVRAVRARGVGEATIVLKHALKNAILPVVSYLGPAAANILTGTVVVETIFAIPGIGFHFVHGALNRDYQLVMGVVLFYCVLLMAFNFLADIVHRLLDPRVEMA